MVIEYCLATQSTIVLHAIDMMLIGHATDSLTVVLVDRSLVAIEVLQSPHERVVAGRLACGSKVLREAARRHIEEQ